MKKKDLEYGIDKTGEFALFIEERHVVGDGWQLDETTKKYIQLEFKKNDMIYFRIIKRGQPQNGHGFIDNNLGEIVQWG